MVRSEPATVTLPDGRIYEVEPGRRGAAMVSWFEPAANIRIVELSLLDGSRWFAFATTAQEATELAEAGTRGSVVDFTRIDG